MPASNYPLSPEFKKHIKENYEEIKNTIHSNTNGHFFKFSEQKILDTSIEEREKIFEKAWLNGGLGLGHVLMTLHLIKRLMILPQILLKEKFIK